jgi:hypothetical protein
MIKNWIGGDTNKITFSLLYKLSDGNRNKFNTCCNVSAPVVFIFFTSKNSIFGAYCPHFNTFESQWKNDSNAFIFSINLNKKYPAKKANENYHRGQCGIHFQDLIFVILI